MTESKRGTTVFAGRSATRRAAVGRALAACWLALVEASTYETDEGVGIVMCWCCPCLPSPQPSPKQRSARDAPAFNRRPGSLEPRTLTEGRGHGT
jgi:hypothetical protein